jgi:hypothetical protein
VFLLADETAPPLQFLCPFIHAASGRGILDELVKRAGDRQKLKIDQGVSNQNQQSTNPTIYFYQLLHS